MDKYGNLKRIDRLVFAGNKIWIIDYKTGEGYQGEHEQQIREYACLIGELYPDREPECWLIYVDNLEIRQVKIQGHPLSQSGDTPRYQKFKL